MASPAETFTHHSHAARDDAQRHVEPFEHRVGRIIRDVWREAADRLRTLAAGADWVMPTAAALLSHDEVERQLRDPLNGFHVEVYKTMLNGTLGRMGIGFDIQNPLIEGTFAQLGGRITMIADDERQRIMAHLDKGWQDGEGIDEVARGMRLFADGFSRSRAATIARTEFAAAVNGASLAGVRIGGVAAYKTWLATEDAHTRDTHSEADGQAVPVDSTFQVGDAQLAYPGDPSGPPEEIVNCRCTVLYGDDASGEATGNDFSASGIHTAGYAVRQRFVKGAVVGSRDSMVTGRMTRVYRDMTAAAVDGEAPLRWQAELAYGDTWTTDGRFLSKSGAQLPSGNWPFMSMLMDDHGTSGPFGGGMQSYSAGHGDKVWWDGNILMGEGSFNDQAAGLAAAQSIQDGDIVGVSIDTFPLEWEVSIPVSEDDLMFFRRKVAQLSPDEIVALVRKGVFSPGKLRAYLKAAADDADSGDGDATDVITIRESVDDFPKTKFLSWQFLGATQVPFPAFDKANIAMLLEADALAAGASGSTSLRLGARDESWDAAAAKKALDPAQYKQAFFWTDPEGDPETLAAYKLPFASPTGGLHAVWSGVTSAAAAIQGSQGGVDLPAGDVAAVKSRIGSYYAKAAKQYDDDSIKVPWDDSSAMLTASGAGLAPLAAPSEWFDVPEPDSYQALTVTKEGQVFGHVARWGECHTAFGVSVAQGQSCTRAPQSHSRYAYYMAGHYLTADDRDVAVGIISLADDPAVKDPHADLGLTADQVRQHYESVCSQAAYVTAVDGKHGIWVCGTVAPHLSAEKVVQLRAAKPSGDWRMINRHMEMLGVLAVNIPGFPVPRARLVAGAVGDEPELVALVAAGYPDALSAAERQARALRIAEGRAGLLSALDAV